MSTSLHNPLRIGPLAVEFSIYTSDSGISRPQRWEAAAPTRTTQYAWHGVELLEGENGEARRAAGTIRVRAASIDDDGFACSVRVEHERPVKALKLAVELPAMPMLAPEEYTLEPHAWRQWDYPRDWRAGFAVWSDAPRYFTLHTRDFPWHFKRLRALSDGRTMRVEIIQDANLRERSFSLESSTWEFRRRDRLDDLLAAHAEFVRQAFGAIDFARRRDMPAWARSLALVVNLHGADWNGRVHLDFAGMTRAAEALAGRIDPARVLLYPIGWDGRYMRDYPSFEPSAGLGGPEGFRDFCRRARSLGFHVMPHLNAMVCNMRQALYAPHLKDYVLRDALGQPQNLYRIDWDHDGLGDAAHSYLALQPPALRDVLVRVVNRLVREFAVDAVFLDETCNVFYNDPAWDQVEGVRRLIHDLRRAQPGLLIAGEEWNEMLLGLTPIVQIWEETADGRKAFGRERSALMRAWAGQFIRSCGYLALASPDGQTGVHEWPGKPWVDERANESYYIPTLALTRDSLERGAAGIDATVERAKDYARRFAAA